MPVGYFQNAPQGIINFEVPETMGVQFKFPYPYVVTPKLAGNPQIQAAQKQQITGSLTLRFSDQYNTAPLPEARFSQIKAIADLRYESSLYLGGVYQGDFVITNISKVVTSMADNGKAFLIDVDIDLLRVN